MSATQQQELMLRIEAMERAGKDATAKFQRDQEVLVQRVLEEQATQLKAQFELESKERAANARAEAERLADARLDSWKRALAQVERERDEILVRGILPALPHTWQLLLGVKGCCGERSGNPSTGPNAPT
jgi:hypothetical protein